MALTTGAGVPNSLMLARGDVSEPDSVH